MKNAELSGCWPYHAHPKIGVTSIILKPNDNNSKLGDLPLLQQLEAEA